MRNVLFSLVLFSNCNFNNSNVPKINKDTTVASVNVDSSFIDNLSKRQLESLILSELRLHSKDFEFVAMDDKYKEYHTFKYNTYRYTMENGYIRAKNKKELSSYDGNGEMKWITFNYDYFLPISDINVEYQKSETIKLNGVSISPNQKSFYVVTFNSQNGDIKESLPDGSIVKKGDWRLSEGIKNGTEIYFYDDPSEFVLKLNLALKKLRNTQ